jgi:NAD(P)-dependent dehydrogenase (short-subunit alcohol dehydrogenase family)
MPDLSAHHAVVTGGGTGIGAAIAHALHGAGARVTLMGRRREPLEDVAAGLPDAAVVTMDVTDEASVEAAIAQARARSPISILVNNAGGAETAPLSKTSMALWQQMIAVNLTGAFLCTRAVLGEVSAAQDGRIVTIASTSGLKGYAYTGAYAAAKHGVIGMTRTLAFELAQTSATANAICPGFADTELVQRSLDNRHDPLSCARRIYPRQPPEAPDKAGGGRCGGAMVVRSIVWIGQRPGHCHSRWRSDVDGSAPCQTIATRLAKDAARDDDH